MVKYFSSYNKEIYHYFNFIKNKKDDKGIFIWKAWNNQAGRISCDTPYKYMYLEFGNNIDFTKNTKYIHDFFYNLDISYKKGLKDEVKYITNDINIICEQLDVFKTHRTDL